MPLPAVLRNAAPADHRRAAVHRQQPEARRSRSARPASSARCRRSTRGRPSSSTSGSPRSPRRSPRTTAPTRSGRRRRSRSTRSCTRATTGSSTTCRSAPSYKVPIVITSLGARTDVNDAVHGWGGVVLHDIINNTFAQEGDREGRRRPDRGRRRRRRPCRREEPVRAGRTRSASGSTARWRCRAPSPPAAPCSRRRRWAPTSPTSARPSSPPRRRAPADAYKQMIVDSTQRRHRLLEPVHRRARQLPEGLDPQRRARPRRPARERPEQDELRRRRDQGVEGHLGLRPGHRRGQGGGAGAASWSRAWRASTRRRVRSSACRRAGPRLRGTEQPSRECYSPS